MKLAIPLALAVAGCVTFPGPLIQRAANELECDATRVNVVQRGDIGYELYDVEACGHRARYSCVGAAGDEPYHCIHEPDPARWDPDPKLAATLPNGGLSSAQSSSRRGVWRRICGTEDHDCAFRQGDTWQWRPAVACESVVYGASCP